MARGCSAFHITRTRITHTEWTPILIGSDSDGFALTSAAGVNWRIRSDKDDPNSELQVYGMNQEGVHASGPSRHEHITRFREGGVLCWAQTDQPEDDEVIATWIGNHTDHY